jgi:GT2 family glycosyltransferase
MGPEHAVGIVHYRSYADLLACLDAVMRQTLPPGYVHVFDVDGEPEARARVATVHPEVCFHEGPNIGYAAAANRLVAAMRAAAPALEYILILNADVVLDPPFCAELWRGAAAHPGSALLGGKLLRPGRKILDSAGIDLPAHRRPRDRGSEAPDRGQYEAEEAMFGVSGAAMGMRVSALDDLALDGELFDEDFFMYHEDTDLCWRAGRLGWTVRYVPRATAVHARGWQKDERFRTAAHIRVHSFKNHYLQLAKNERLGDFLLRLPVLLVWEVMRLGFALLRDRPILAGYAAAGSLLAESFRKRRLLIARCSQRND